MSVRSVTLSQRVAAKMAFGYATNAEQDTAARALVRTKSRTAKGQCLSVVAVSRSRPFHSSHQATRTNKSAPQPKLAAPNYSEKTEMLTTILNSLYSPCNTLLTPDRGAPMRDGGPTADPQTTYLPSSRTKRAESTKIGPSQTAARKPTSARLLLLTESATSVALCSIGLAAKRQGAIIVQTRSIPCWLKTVFGGASS